ncbi:MAG: DUF1573 domain-containing protein [Muribaculaceae bacterium]|nr:DUF1573 domain-containing protein [Muribaculaceae bacterium]MDE6831974.1 DUF1573 domain-containing protein [Muribaculaceae bacterium]
MKNLLLTILIGAGATVAAQAEPEVKFLTETHDFGAFDENDGTVSCDFPFVNVGDEPLMIVAARATCGCTTPHYTKDAVAPGDTGVVTVKYNPTGRPGRFGKKVYVDFNTDIPRHTLLVKGVVIGSSNTLRGRYPVDAGPVKMRNRSILFGDVPKGRSKSAFFELYNATADTLTPAWSNLPEGLTVTTATPAVAPGEQATYTFYFRPIGSDMYGTYTDTLTLRPSANADPITIDMAAIVEEDFSTLTTGQLRDAPHMEIKERLVDFGIVKPTQGLITGKFTITNKGKDPLMLRRIYTTDPGVTVTSSTDKVKKGKSATVTVTVDPLALPSEIINARISIITNDPDNASTIMRAVGQLKSE